MSVQRWLSLILAATVLGRVAFLVLFGHTLSLETSGYDTYAANLADGRGYTRFDDRDADSELPPLYPFFLAGVYTLFGRDPIPVALVQTAFDGLTALLLFLIGRRVAGETVGLLAAALYGLYPYLLFQNLTENDTAIFILLLVCAVWLAYRAHDTRDWRLAAALGAVFGLAALTKLLIVLILPLLALWWWRQIGLRAAARLALIAGAALVIVIAPWVIRNTRLHGELVLISTNGGSNLHQGNNACVADTLARGWDAQWVDCLNTPPDGLSELETDRWHRDQALEYLRDHPDEWLHLFGTKLLVLWSPAIMPHDLPPDADREDDAVLQYNTTAFEAARIVHLLYFTPLLVLGVIGLGLAWRDRLPVGPLLAVMTAITVGYVIFHSSTRYRSPADPFLFVLSAYAITRAWAWLAPRLPVKYQRRSLLK
ncbi:MAG: glycosyltransferase family 39 protein [Anaerolineae bacterium]|nr:glycosyltransferase family 39 protein [Anaerolineae bacterium]